MQVQDVQHKTSITSLRLQSKYRKPLRVLNLYAGIGGNRKLWRDVHVTTVEHNEAITYPWRTVNMGYLFMQVLLLPYDILC
jgi:hypothetical protein